MFKDYFRERNREFLQVREKNSGKKNAALTDHLLHFCRDHVNDMFEMRQGKVVDSFGQMVEDVDIIINFIFHNQMWQMMAETCAIEHVFGVAYVVSELTDANLKEYLQKIVYFKSLSQKSELEDGGSFRKIPAVLFAYESKISYTDLKDKTLAFYAKNDILTAYEADLVVILNKSILIKDWHDNSMRYRSIETQSDTLMWFYILFHEYIMGSNPLNLNFNFRNYVKGAPKYSDY